MNVVILLFLILLVLILLDEDFPLQEVIAAIVIALSFVGLRSLMSEKLTDDIKNYNPNLISDENPDTGKQKPDPKTVMLKMAAENTKLYEKMPTTRMSYDDYDTTVNKAFFSGDDQFTSKGKDMGANAKRAIDIRSTYDATSIRGYFDEELEEHADRIWFEDNGDLEKYM